MHNPSPLRYPGGKCKFYPVVRDILRLNDLLGTTYIEPFAGGAGLALRLLFSGDVNRIIINDYDPHIYAFWYAALKHSEALCDLIDQIPVDIAERERQKTIYSNCDLSHPLQLGFATFFLNRTNVSGVLNGGVIGGNAQAGEYKIDARYDKPALIAKIREIANYRENILLLNSDAVKLFSYSEVKNTRNTFVNFDPPYVTKGARLYKNSFGQEDHLALARHILKIQRKWIVTYDVSPLILKAYSACRIGYLNVSYSLRDKKSAQEYIIFGNSLRMPESILLANDALHFKENAK
ncbi:MAG: DNA adenine methylase [Alphaproteobacteria bacterium]|nr:DNA adenine methylase [Alphaproteobacteria bacterium]